MTTLLPTVRDQLHDAAALRARRSKLRSAGGLPQLRPLRHWRRAPLIALAFVLAGGALAAGGVIHFGKPAEPPPGDASSPRSGLGSLSRGTQRLLPIATPDPVGGSPWGMRIFSTTRGVGCIQVGRLLEGKLGVLGRDGAFNDDGLFHELRTSALLAPYDCTNLDANGRIFTNVTVGDEPASGWGAVGRYAYGGCVPATSTPVERKLTRKICPAGDERDLYYGLLGPDASSVTYALAGQRHTVPTVGPWGAYLIVTRASPHQLFDFAAGGTSDVVPVDGPITEVHYRDGAVCHITARSWIGGADACTPALKVPVGYVAPKRVVRTSAQVATPLRVRLVRGAGGRYEILVGFTARVAIAHARSTYLLKWHAPSMPSRVDGYMPTQSDIAKGQAISERIGRLGSPLSAGTVSGTVTFVESAPSSENEASALVGRFSVRVP
jgi:hypothetical protein